MRFHVISALSLICAASAAQAVTVIPVLTKADVEIDGNMSPPNPGLPTSYNQQIVTGEDFAAKVTAFQNETGFSQIEVDITSYEDDGSFAADGVPGHKLSATTFLVLDFLNETMVAENVLFNFTLSNMSLHTFNAAGGIGPKASLIFGVVNSGSSVGGDPDFFGNVDLRGTFNDAKIEHANELVAGPLVRTFCTGDICYGADLTINDYSGTFDLGLVNPGERAQVTVILDGIAEFDGYEMGAEVFAIDPNGGSAFSYSVTSTPVVPVSPVPLPAGLMLGLTSLICLAGLGRRRRTT